MGRVRLGHTRLAMEFQTLPKRTRISRFHQLESLQLSIYASVQKLGSTDALFFQVSLDVGFFQVHYCFFSLPPRHVFASSV